MSASGVTPELPAEVLRWCAGVLGSTPAVVRGLRRGGSPWLLQAGDRRVVLRTGDPPAPARPRPRRPAWPAPGPRPARSQAALDAAAPARAPEPTAFVRGDLWQANTLWAGDRLTGIIDWDCAGTGAPPGLSWFAEATATQGRPDLTRDLVAARHEDFLRQALDHLKS